MTNSPSKIVNIAGKYFIDVTDTTTYEPTYSYREAEYLAKTGRIITINETYEKK